MTRVHIRPARMVTPHTDDCFLSGGDDGRWPCICDHNERWNRICHSDALREMQLEPAETPAPLAGYRPHWSLYVMSAGLCFVLTVMWSVS